MPAPRLPKQEPVDAVLSVERRPVPPDLSHIPSDLADYYEARGMRVTLASALDNNIARLSLHQRFPLYFDEIPEAIRGDQGRSLTRYGFLIERDSGRVKKGDCCLFVQPLDARAEEHGEALRQWLEQDSPTAAENTAAEINDIFLRDPNASRLKNSGVSVNDGGRLSDHAGRMFAG